MGRLDGDRSYAYYDSPLGRLRIGYAGERLYALERVEAGEDVGCRSGFSDRVIAQIREYLRGERREFALDCHLEGTDFQRRVWAELIRIPYGETRTYGQIARAIGQPGSARAVGGANNKNPIPIVIPCHRVVGADGGLVGYAGGLDMKLALLDLEQGRGLASPPE